MAGILKVDQYQDFNGNNIMTRMAVMLLLMLQVKNTPAFKQKLVVVLLQHIIQM